MHRHILATVAILLSSTIAQAYITTFAREIGPGNFDGTRWETRFVPPHACQCGEGNGLLSIPGLGVNVVVHWVGGWSTTPGEWPFYYYSGHNPFDVYYPPGLPYELMPADMQFGVQLVTGPADPYVFFRSGRIEQPTHGGDYNYDGAIDAADAGVLFGGWEWNYADITGDNLSDAADASVLFSQWNGDVSPNTIPEPSGLGVTFLALVFLRNQIQCQR